MNCVRRAAWTGALLALTATPLCAESAAPATVQRVALLGAGNTIELEISTSQAVKPQVQLVASPDRLVLDFPNASPGALLRNLAVNRGEVKAVRVGLFSSHPPVTRLVVDLKSPQEYQMFPAGKSVIVKFGRRVQPVAASAMPAPASTTTVMIERVPLKPPPRVEVDFVAGQLRIWADKATLAEVLREVHRKTGAEIAIPAGAEQEQVVVHSGPAPAKDVLAALFNGSQFDFVLVGSDRDSRQLRSVMLRPRGAGTSNAVVYSNRNEPVAQAAVPTPDPGPAPEVPNVPETTPEEAPQNADSPQ